MQTIVYFEIGCLGLKLEFIYFDVIIYIFEG